MFINLVKPTHTKNHGSIENAMKKQKITLANQKKKEIKNNTMQIRKKKKKKVRILTSLKK